MNALKYTVLLLAMSYARGQDGWGAEYADMNFLDAGEKTTSSTSTTTTPTTTTPVTTPLSTIKAQDKIAEEENEIKTVSVSGHKLEVSPIRPAVPAKKDNRTNRGAFEEDWGQAQPDQMTQTPSLHFNTLGGDDITLNYHGETPDIVLCERTVERLRKETQSSEFIKIKTWHLATAVGVVCSTMIIMVAIFISCIKCVRN